MFIYRDRQHHLAGVIAGLASAVLFVLFATTDLLPAAYAMM